MSVLIKGIEFPECCYACDLNLWHTECFLTGHEFHQIFGEDIDPSKERHPDCPLVEVPTPHGRLIDADALLESIKEAKKKQPEISDVYDEDYFAVAEWVAYAPTIIESEGE